MTEMESSATDDVFFSEDKDYSQNIYNELKEKHDRKTKAKATTTLSKLDRRHMLTTLVFLKHNRPAIKSDIYANISRNVNMADKLETLQKLGLITIYDSFERNTCYIVLTDKGEKIANMIEEMLDEIDKKEEYKPPSIYSYWKETQRPDDE